MNDAPSGNTNSESLLRGKLFKERVRLLYKRIFFTLITNLLTSAILVAILWDEVPHSSLLLWVFWVYLVTGFRYLEASLFKNTLLTTRNSGKWKKSFMIGVAASGVVWGAAGFFLMPVESFVHQIFLTFVLGGMALGALAAYSVVLEVYITYLVAVLVPLATRLFMFGDDIHIATGTLVVIYLMVMGFVASHFFQETMDSLKLRFENIYLNELLESKKRIEAITTSAIDAIIMIDNDSRVVFWNPAAEKIFGFTIDDVLGKKLSKLIVPHNFREDHENGFRAFRNTGKGPIVGQKMELEGLRKSGETFPIELSVSAILLGNQWHAIGTIRDITQHKQAEKELEKSERTYATLLSNLPGMVYRCKNDENWTMEFVSEGCEPLTGYKPSDLTQNRAISFAEIIHPDDRAMVWETIQKALEENRQFQLQYRIITADGEEKWAWEKGVGIYSPVGGLVSLEGFISDVTERVEAERIVHYRLKIEKALAAISGLFISEEYPDFNVLLKILGETVSVSRASIYMSNGDDPEIRKTHEWLSPGAVFDVHIPDVVDMSRFEWLMSVNNTEGCIVIKDVEKLLSSAKVEADYFRSLNIRSIVVVPISAEAGRIEGMIGFDDIDSSRNWSEGDIRLLRVASVMIANYMKRMRSEKELRLSNERLKEAMRDLEKTQSMLIRSEKLASMGKLSAGVAHEIKNPLNIISTSVQLLMMDDGVPAETMEYYNTIMDQVARTVKITENLRDFARKRKPQKKDIDLQKFINKTIALVEYEMKIENIEVARDFDPAPINIYCDPDQLAQVFLNIISNARDSMNERQNSLSYEALKESGWEGRLSVDAHIRGPWVHITFDDTGIGITDEVAANIFDPFFTTKDETKGTGLGMAIAYGIIENHGGRIEAGSNGEGGARISVILPLPDHNIPI